MYFRLILLLLAFPVALSAQGIEFEHISWPEALEKARKEGKLVFLDAYTTWCGPCKMLASKTFPDSAVGDLFNRSFVNLKIDMEKGEGVDLALKYGVDVYPTLLFFQPDGMVAHRAAGYFPVAEMIQLGKNALDSTQNLRALEMRYRNGDRDRELLRQLLGARAVAYDPRTGALADEYLKQEKDLNAPENKQIILRYVNDPLSEGFKFLVHHREAFQPEVTPAEVGTFIDQVFESYLESHPMLQLGEVQRLYGACYPEQGERLASSYRMTYYRQRSDYDRFAESAVDHYTRYPSDDLDELNEVAWLFAENINDPAMLEQALTWAKQSIAIGETAYNQDTMARVLAKQGKKKSAVKAAQRSIELAQAAGEDFSQTQALLDLLEKKK